MSSGEQLARRIRATLKRFNDNSKPVTALVDSLVSEVARAEKRIEKLEEGLHGIANCDFGYHQSAQEAASWMNSEAMRLLTSTIDP